MIRKICFVMVFLLLATSILLCSCKGFEEKASSSLDTTTQWELKPSFKYDVLCFMNTLIGDDYYLRFYRDDYDRIREAFTPEVMSALEVLKIQRENFKVILGAWLSNLYSTTDDETLDDMISTLDSDTQIWDNYNYTEEEKEAFEMYAKDNLRIVFKFLKDNDFEGYWRENILPKIEQRIAQIEAGVSRYDIIPVVEKYTGFELPSEKITLYMLYFAQPHGIRIQGTNFLTDVSYDSNTILGNAIHEMLHPPFQPDNTEFINARAKLENDEFIKTYLAKQDETHGYTTYESYFEENCVDALEVLIREDLGLMQGDAKTFFKTHDNGIDALGAVIYYLAKKENGFINGESFQEFIIRIIDTGKLTSGTIEELYDDFYSK